MLKELAASRMAYLPHLPLRKGTTPLRLAPEYEEWLVEAMNHGADDAFWAQDPEGFVEARIDGVGTVRTRFSAA